MKIMKRKKIGVHEYKYNPILGKNKLFIGHLIII